MTRILKRNVTFKHKTVGINSKSRGPEALHNINFIYTRILEYTHNWRLDFFPKSACSLWLHTHNWWMDFFPRAHALSDFFKVTANETISRQNFWPCCNVFTSSKKHEIRRFHVAVVQDGKETYKKACVHVQCCFFFLIQTYCIFPLLIALVVVDAA